MQSDDSAGAETPQQLRDQLAELRLRLEEAQDTLRAIRSGDVDAFVVEQSGTQRVYTLEGADRPYRMWVESMQQGAATLARDGRVTYCNNHFGELLGASPEALLGLPLRRFIADDQKADYDALLSRGLGGAGVGETWLQRADGSGVPVLLSVNALALDGAALGVLATDLTVQRHHDRLARALAARERLESELRQVVTDLSEADRRKSEFLAMLAHELRNPLAPIRNALRVLQPPGVDRRSAKPLLAMMQRQVEQMVRLIDDLLDVSRISRGAIELRKSNVELGAIVEQAVEVVRPSCERMQQRLTVTLPAEPIFLNADPTRLVQAIGNLLHNASKFTSQGGSVALNVERGDGHAVLRVRDSGIGIAADQLQRVFELFAQVDASLERSQGGLGLGLTLVKTLVELHGGTVEARSDGIGSGSEFVMRLPRLAAAPAAPPPAAGMLAPVAKRRRVLVVDDNRDAAESLAAVLELGGHEVRVAYDGLEAVDAAAQTQPELVLLDIGLPKLNGFEAARRIRVECEGRPMMLVALTGWGQDDDRRRSRDSGFDAHLVKPVDPAVLERLLAELDAG